MSRPRLAFRLHLVVGLVIAIAGTIALVVAATQYSNCRPSGAFLGGLTAGICKSIHMFVVNLGFGAIAAGAVVLAAAAFLRNGPQGRIVALVIDMLGMVGGALLFLNLGGVNPLGYGVLNLGALVMALFGAMAWSLQAQPTQNQPATHS